MPVLPAVELLPPNPHGRTFDAERRVRLGDVGVDARVRLDAIARYLQDIATDDARAADLPNALGWVVRRTMIRVDEPCRLNEDLRLTTFCTGSGRSWAERRTSIVGARGGTVEAVSLWVQIEARTGRPTRLSDEFFDRYGPAAADRKVSSKLSLARPPDDAVSRPWSFRRADLDPFDHINNAAQWVVMDELTTERRGRFELEHITAVPLGPLTVLTHGTTAWLAEATGDGSSVARAAMAWHPLEAASSSGG